jgi:hypothetical protein
LSNALKAFPAERGAPFGGLMAALCVKTARLELGVETPLRTLTVQFQSAARFEPVRFSAARLRGGRTTLFAEARADQAGKPVLASLMTFGASGPGPEHRPLPSPSIRLGDGRLDDRRIPWFTDGVEYHFEGEPDLMGGRAEALIRGLFRVRDEGPLDELKLCFLLDALYPNYFLVLGPSPATSVDLRYDLFSAITPDVSPDGWVWFEFHTRDCSDGWAVEDGIAWAPDGAPLAVARQLRKSLAIPT